ncbi:hypothetical protein [Microbacterium sp. G2-8]|nr:hypothetical protein [Microbacterium sp. G2-8]
MSKQAREAEVLALQKRALDPNDEYDGSDAMVRPEGDRGDD